MRSSFFRNQKSERTADREHRVYSIQLSIAIMIELFCYHVSFSLESEHELEKLQERSLQEKVSRQNFKSNLSRCNEKSTQKLQSFDLVDIFNDKRRSFQVSITHSSNDRSRTSRRLKKQTQVSEAFMQNEFFIFKSYRNNSRFRSDDDFSVSSKVEKSHWCEIARMQYNSSSRR